MKQKAGVPRPTPAEQENNWKFVSMSSVRDGDSSKLNENLPAITEPWEWGMGFKRAHFNGRALNPPGTSMSFSFHAVPFPLHESPAYSLSSSSVSSGHRSTAKAVIYSFLHFYKLTLTSNLAQTAVTSEKCVKGARLYL